MNNIKEKAELIWARLFSIKSQVLTPEEEKKIYALGNRNESVA